MKKRSLILSTALLLVAILACTSATYAWFTSNSTTEVTNITAKVDARSSLLISNDDVAPAPGSTAWKTSVSYQGEQYTLTDLSSEKGITGTFFSRNVDENDVETFAGGATGYVDFKLHFISSINGNLIVTPNFDTKDVNDSLVEKAARIAFLNEDGTTSYFVWEPDATSGVVNNAGYNTTDVLAVTGFDANADPKLTTVAQVTKSGALNKEVVTDLAANTAKTIIVRVWLEGQDAQCANYITGSNIEASFVFGCDTIA